MCKCKPESIDEAVDYFITIGSNKLEGETFWYHFSSNGFKVGGKAPMKNWHSAAQCWVRRNKQRDAPRPGNSKLQRMNRAIAASYS